MAGDGTVEWGGDRPLTLIDRVFGAGWVSGGRRLSAPALAAAVVSAALFMVAETLPWMTVGVGGDGPPGAPGGGPREVHIDAIGIGYAVGYYVGLLLLFTLVGLALVSRPHTRRSVAAAGCGLAVAVLVLVLGAVSRAGDGGQFGSFDQTPADVGSAPFVAIAALLLAVGAFVLSGWRPAVPTRRERRDTEPDESEDPDDPDEEPGPIDLTVTPA